MVNQIELHPRFTREELVLFCWNHGMLVQSWAPLIRGGVTAIPELGDIARIHDKTEAQIALRWAVQHNFAVIPKSTSPERIKENAQIFDFVLSPQEMAKIDSLNRDTRIGPNPEEYSWHNNKS
jgi:diketogulonate reductase-like aldo/keto reductase